MENVVNDGLEKWNKTMKAMQMPRRDCSCGGKTVLDSFIPSRGKFASRHEFYVRCLNNACPRSSDILFDDPIEAVNYWNYVGWQADPLGTFDTIFSEVNDGSCS